MTGADLVSLARSIAPVIKEHVAAAFDHLSRRVAELEVRAPIPGRDGRDGERGPEGPAGPTGGCGEAGPPGDVGPRGPIGLTGERGPQGETVVGPQGPTGPQGERGADAVISRDMLVEVLLAEPRLLEKAIAVYLQTYPIPAGPAGRDGIDGKDGAPGRDGLPGRRGADAVISRDMLVEVLLAEPRLLEKAIAVYLQTYPIPAGPAGRDGIDGKDGAPGRDGLPGVPGREGAPGANGKDGADGLNGKDGKDAVMGQLTATHDGERTLTLTWADGTVFGRFKGPNTIYRGVYQPNSPYQRFDQVTLHGSTWTALEDTDSRPGDGNPAWQLSSKAGRPGRDGKDGKEGPQGRPGMDLTIPLRARG